MTYSFQIKKHHNDLEWKFGKSLHSINEFTHLKSLCKKQFYGFSAQFIPVRTNGTKNLIQDFFVPSVTRSAIKVDSCCLEKIFIRIMECILDLITLPIRCFTLLPRLIYNAMHSKEKDPFYHYLKAQGVNEDLLKKDFIYLKFEWEESIQGPAKIFEEESYKGFIDLPNKRKWQTKSFRSREKTAVPN